MATFGYAGGVLRVDLSSRQVTKEPLDVDLIDKYIGGMGIGCRLAYENIKPGIDALSSENVLVVSAGPLVGTSLPGTPKTACLCKSPLTNTLTIAACGMFGGMLKYAGYDVLLITGRSPNPVYLEILDDDVQMRDASDLWGLDLFEATEKLWSRYGRCDVACIGPAGENLVRYAVTLINKVSTWGRNGYGAVLGSKNLKAIVVRGTKGIRVPNPRSFRRFTETLLERFAENPARDQWHELGTMMALETFWKQGYGPSRGYSSTSLLERFGADKYLQHKVVGIADLGCPLGCRALLKTKDGEQSGLRTPVSCAFAFAKSAAVMELADFSELINCFDQASRYGIDILEVCEVIPLVVEHYRQGLISKEEMGGLEPKPGFDISVKLLEKIARRDGIGDILAEGWGEIFEWLGKDAPEKALTVKGKVQEIDARAVLGTETFGQVVNPRGADPKLGLGQTTNRGVTPERLKRYAQRIGMPEQAMERVFSGPSGFNVARFTKHVEDWNTIMDSLGMCSRVPIARIYDIGVAAEAYNLTTGRECTPQHLLECGERVWNVYKSFNAREGFNRKDDSPPSRWFSQPILADGKELWVRDYVDEHPVDAQEFGKLLDAYYGERGWDISTGNPTRRKLEELGLADVAADLGL